MRERRLISDRYVCDPHGKELVRNALHSLPLGAKVESDVPGAVLCGISLILSRPHVAGEYQYISLRELCGNRWLGHSCGMIEAATVLSYLRRPSINRPLTHDLIESTASALGAKVEYVILDEVTPDRRLYFGKIVCLAKRAFWRSMLDRATRFHWRSASESQFT